MLKEALQYLVNLREPTVIVDGPARRYSDQQLHPIQTKLPDRLEVSSLQSLVDLTKEVVPALLFVDVERHDSVLVIDRALDEWNRRTERLHAKPPESQQFRFGQWYDQETFIIALQSMFALGGDLDYVLNLANNITTGKVTTSEDDGVTQRVTVKKGAALKQVLDMKRRVSLAPYRTFREVEQPFSDFVFRVKQVDDEVPALALFEADGGKWKLDAAAAVRDYLAAKLEGYLIVA